MVLALALGVLLAVLLVGDADRVTDVRFVLAVSLLTLFLHQTEEYVRPGGFPQMANRAMFRSQLPDRFPLNQRTACVINVGIGWSSYAAAAIAGPHALWLGIATLMVSVGNVVAHTLIFNIRGRTLYNPGLATCWLLFVPVIVWFTVIVVRDELVGPVEAAIGLLLGLALNYLGVLRLIVLLGDPETPYAFPAPS